MRQLNQDPSREAATSITHQTEHFDDHLDLGRLIGNATRMLRMKQVQEKTNLSRSSIYAEIAKGNFPRQYQLSARCVGWSEAEINLWLATRMKVEGRSAYQGEHHE